VVACLVAAARALIPDGAAGQSATLDTLSACPEGRITAIFVDTHSIYDVGQVHDGGLLGWVYGTANALHVKTRESFVRRELLFHVGDCYDHLLIEESGRILRNYSFLARADVYPVDQPDGNKHVVVDTQDEWTTRVDLGLSFDSGLQLEALELSEENLVGQGIQASVFYRQRKERQDIGGRVGLPRLFHTRTDASVSAGRTRSGTFLQEQVAYPFVGEVGRLALRQAYSRRDELFPYVVSDPALPYSHVLLPNLDERVELSVAGRLGRPGNLTMFGLGVSRETLDFEGFPGSLEIARENDFSNTAPAPPGVEDDVRHQVHPLSTTRVDFFLGQRNIRFARVRGLDALTGIQDIQLGTDLGLTLGRSIDVLSASGLEGANDLYARMRFFAAHDPGTSYIFLNVGAEGRDILSGGEDGDGWQDLIGEVDLYGYLRSRKTPDHTFFARVSGAGGWSMNTPFQLTLGGRQSVRGLREEDFPGSRRVLLTVEDRYFVRNWPAPTVFDLGLTLFADAGRVWAGEVPYGVDSGWKGTIGGGLRLGFPTGTRGLARLDLAFPLGMDNTRGPIFRVTLQELLGLRVGFQDPQLQRSRRLTVGPDYFTTDRR
jgi:hypothetical protein